MKEFFHYYPWYQLPESVRARTLELYDRLADLGAELLGWIQAGLPDEVSRSLSCPLPAMVHRSQDTLLRVLHYPPLEPTTDAATYVGAGAIRAAAHEDINLITLLCAATESGLQVKDLEGAWHDVPCEPGQIAVNSGDMLQLATAGYFRSTTHQVINPDSKESHRSRYSMPLFLHPRPDVRLTPEVTAGEFLRERLVQIGLKS